MPPSLLWSYLNMSLIGAVVIIAHDIFLQRQQKQNKKSPLRLSGKSLQTLNLIELKLETFNGTFFFLNPSNRMTLGQSVVRTQYIQMLWIMTQ